MKNRIREVLQERGITQKELAQAIGMSEIGLSKALDGSATKATIDKIATYLAIDVDDLMVKDPILRAKYGSDRTPLKFGELEIQCYVLDNGTRVLSGRGMQKALGSTSTSGAWLTKFVNNGPLSPLFDTGTNSIKDRINNPIRFIRNNAGGSQLATNGYEATLLIDICSVIIDENRTGNFNDLELVKCADIIIRSVAKVGIIALIDEATGYNKEKTRAKDELQKYLSSFLREEAARWVKTFPDSFFEDIYKMKNWTWQNTSKRPGVVGRIIGDIVYDRIGPCIHAELERINPKNERGNRSSKHHQHLTDVGKIKLGEHLATLHGLAIVSDYRWEKFMAYVDKTYPKQYQQLSLFDPDDFE